MTRYDVTDSNFVWIADCCIMRTFRRRHRRKIRAQTWSLFARLFNTQKLQYRYSTSKQFLIKYTSTSSSLNFGTIIINYFLFKPEIDQSGFKCVSRFCVHNVIRQTADCSVPHIDIILLVKKLRRSYLARFFCNLKSLPLVVTVGS